MENGPKTYRGLLTCGEWRMLFAYVSRAKPENRTQERWLFCADEALMKVANVDAELGQYIFKAVEKPSDLIETELTPDALKGVKFATVKAMAGTTWAERKMTLDVIQKGFGKKLREMVNHEARLPEADDKNEDKELEGI